MIVRIRGGIPVRRLTLALRLIQRITLTASVCLLSWPLFVSAESLWTQWSAEHHFAASKANRQETVVAGSPAKSPSRTALPPGSLLARFEIPRLGLKYALLEGTDNRTLDKSIGHVTWSSLPGGTGNIGIAGHRNTHFRKLEWIRRGDEIVLTSAEGQFRYQVEWSRLFRPEDIEVLDPAHGPAVTLVTCFPFEYVGSAPLRFIIRALPDAETRARLSAGKTQNRKGG